MDWSKNIMNKIFFFCSVSFHRHLLYCLLSHIAFLCNTMDFMQTELKKKTPTALSKCQFTNLHCAIWQCCLWAGWQVSNSDWGRGKFRCTVLSKVVSGSQNHIEWQPGSSILWVLGAFQLNQTFSSDYKASPHSWSPQDCCTV